MCQTLRHYTLSSHCEKRKGIRSGGTAPQMLTIGIRRVVARLKQRPLYSCRKGSRHPLNKQLVAPQSRSEVTSGQDYSLVMLEIWREFLSPHHSYCSDATPPTTCKLFLYLWSCSTNGIVSAISAAPSCIIIAVTQDSVSPPPDTVNCNLNAVYRLRFALHYVRSVDSRLLIKDSAHMLGWGLGG